MKIALTYSSKEGLKKEYFNRNGRNKSMIDIPPDLFAEGDSFTTINAIKLALKNGGHQVFGLEADESVEFSLNEIRPHLVFNIAEGLWGDLRESYVPFISERLGLPYTGSEPLTLAICLNKSYAKRMMQYYRIPTAEFHTISKSESLKLENDFFPAILKPVSEGSSKGIFNSSIVNSAWELQSKMDNMFLDYGNEILVEKFLQGREFTVAIWGNGKEIEVLPIVEIIYSELPEGSYPIYSYEAKWIWDTVEKPLNIFQCPANIDSELYNRIKETCLMTYRVFKIRDWCRIDVRLDQNNNVNIIELNPLPGILPDPKENSCFPKAARSLGYDYNQMINKILQISCKRYGLES